MYDDLKMCVCLCICFSLCCAAFLVQFKGYSVDDIVACTLLMEGTAAVSGATLKLCWNMRTHAHTYVPCACISLQEHLRKAIGDVWKI